MIPTKKWFTISLWSFVLVALYGLLMRYKIAFYFPFFEQKNMLHAHSHFAFSGWISHVLYCGLFTVLEPYISHQAKKKFHLIIGANYLFALGMLVSFTLQGYKAVSVTFSTLTIAAAVCYTWLYIANISQLPAQNKSKPWAIAGLFLNIFSSLGPLLLGYMIATHSITQNLYLGSIYFYLHFQYNGWFLFGSLALIISYLPSEYPSLKKYFYPFLTSAVITLFLSLLWFKLPLWLNILVAIASITQLVIWCMMLYQSRTFFKKASNQYFKRWNIFFYIAALAFVIKFFLQFLTVIPSLSQLVFGFRPMVIAYLHLVLLSGYSVFFFGYFLAKQYIHLSNTSVRLAFVLLTGIIINQLFLSAQGVAAFGYFIIPYINLLLLAVAVLIFGSAIALAITQLRKSPPMARNGNPTTA